MWKYTHPSFACRSAKVNQKAAHQKDGEFDEENWVYDKPKIDIDCGQEWEIGDNKQDNEGEQHKATLKSSKIVEYLDKCSLGQISLKAKYRTHVAEYRIKDEFLQDHS